MTEKQPTQDKIREIVDRIEKGILEVFASENYARYLRTMSRFHRYSVNNQMLIFLQKPDATLVAGYTKWRDQFKRTVIHGEKGIKIIAPAPIKRKIESQKRDPVTKLPLFDPNGNKIMEQQEILVPMFKPSTVFDISQTEGEPLPQIAAELSGNVENYDVFLAALQRASPVPIVFQSLPPNKDGFFSADAQKITIREGMSQVQTICAIVHEIAHAKLHNPALHHRLDDRHKFDAIEICSKPALFREEKIDDDLIPKGLYKYELWGHDDSRETPSDDRPSENSFVNTIITAEPINLMLGFSELAMSLMRKWEQKTIKEFYEEVYPDATRERRSTKEVEAESIAYTVCSYYGIETGENSFGYIASWSQGKELEELRESLTVINKTSGGLISDIDKHYRDITKERETDPIPSTSLLQKLRQPLAGEGPFKPERGNERAL